MFGISDYVSRSAGAYAYDVGEDLDVVIPSGGRSSVKSLLGTVIGYHDGLGAGSAEVRKGELEILLGHFQGASVFEGYGSHGVTPDIGSTLSRAEYALRSSSNDDRGRLGVGEDRIIRISHIGLFDYDMGAVSHKEEVDVVHEGNSRVEGLRNYGTVEGRRYESKIHFAFAGMVDGGFDGGSVHLVTESGPPGVIVNGSFAVNVKAQVRCIIAGAPAVIVGTKHKVLGVTYSIPLGRRSHGDDIVVPVGGSAVVHEFHGGLLCYRKGEILAEGFPPGGGVVVSAHHGGGHLDLYGVVRSHALSLLFGLVLSNLVGEVFRSVDAVGIQRGASCKDQGDRACNQQ